MMSAKLIPPASPSTNSCPGVGTGSGTCLTSSTSGSPNRLMTRAFMGKVYQRDGEPSWIAATEQLPSQVLEASVSRWFFRSFGASSLPSFPPRAGALGYILAPLRGYPESPRSSEIPFGETGLAGLQP